jgi:hypothetical protein
MTTVLGRKFTTLVAASCSYARAIAITTAFFGAFSGNVYAQTPNTVTLKLDGGEDVTGELVEFTGDLFRIQSLVGMIAISAEGVSCIGAACPEGTRLETTGGLLVLTSLDGSATVRGNLIEVSNDQYVIATDFGEMRIDQSKVSCEGFGCVTSEVVLGGNIVLAGEGSTIEGVLVEVTDDAYLVDIANVGVVRVKKDAFECTGTGCP